MAKFKGYRTLILGCLTMVGAAVQSSTGVLTPDQSAEALAVVGALIIFLRTITNGPMGGGKQ